MTYRRILIILITIWGTAGIFGLITPAQADETDDSWVSKVISIQGSVAVKRNGESAWKPIQLGHTLFAGDQVRVDANSRAGIVLRNDSVLRLDQNSTLVFTEIEKETTFIFRLLKGAANFFSRRPRSLKILTPFVNGVVEGTEFYVQVDDDQTRIDLFEGRLLATNPYGEVQMSRGQGVTAAAESAPQQRLLVKPRDSVQWALYYPPVLAMGPGEMPVEIQTAMKSARKGRWIEALNDLELIENDRKNSDFYAFRAGLLLHQGSISEAQTDLGQSLKMDPENSQALALQAIIAVVQNRREEAMRIAQDAVRTNAESASAHLALSYARQAHFDLQGAMQAAETAVALMPENGTARARLAELRLSNGLLNQGLKEARKAVTLNPDESHAHTLLGFAYLTQIKTKKSQEAFEKAIVLDSAAPLPRLGMGLAKIRRGALHDGRAEIEIAVGLDPLNAIMRSYLGKAYFDEKRGPLDAKQLEIAKSLDPDDPTPWLYDAIRKQSVNRPVEALADLQKSIALNDNRAIYRSRLMLDEDLAARSASLGRIFNDLDFQHLALVEGRRSLNTDSSNYSVHRLLADTYSAKPRHEIARVSELLQAQLFQPINLNPVQAQLAETDGLFFDRSGPAAPSFNEFNPLFTRNRATLQASAISGSNHTWGHEITGAGVLNNLSLSVGEFHYETDGFRENNDDKQDIFDVFLQGSLTPTTSLQAEYRHSERESGDLSQNFDGLFSSDQRDTDKLMTKRFGLLHRFAPQFKMAVSVLHSDSEIKRDSVFSGLPGTRILNVDSTTYEVRTDLNHHRFGLITGISYKEGKLFEDWRVTFFGFDVPLVDNEQERFFKKTAYAYSSFESSDWLTWVLGASADELKVGPQIERKQFNPKLGLALRPWEDTTLRLAGFRVLSSRYELVQTIEPTQVNGFNQFFDDIDASDVRSYGAAVDQKFTKRLFGGLEYLRRDLEVPQFDIAGATRAVFFDWQEQTGLAYLYWAPIAVLSARAEYQYEQFDRKENAIGTGIVDVDTHRVPLSINYFHPSGISIRLAATYFFQEGKFVSTDNPNREFSDSDNFWIVDAEAAYRFPKRWGILRIGVKNLFDEEFNYKDTDPSNPAAVPGFMGYAKLTFSF